MKKIISVLLCFITLFAVMLPVSAAENIALGKRAFASSEFNEVYCVANINDGDYNTAWSEGDIVLTGDKGGYSYIAVDLGGPYLINQIKAVSRQDFDQVADRSGWLFQVSNDPNFETAKDVGRRIDGGEFKSSTTIDLSLKETYRYVRVCSRTYAVVAELEVYGESAAAGGIADYIDIEDETVDGAAKLLSYLEIMEGISFNEFGPKHLITRAEASKIIISLINAPISGANEIYYNDVPQKHAYAGYINTCADLGIISQAELFNPDAYIKTVDFLKMLVSAMGYSVEVQKEGGYPSGVLSVVNTLNLNKGISIEYDKNINRETVAEVLLNAFKAPVLRAAAYYGDATEYSKDETLLSQYYNLSINSGIVKANNVTTLSSPSLKSGGYVEIGEEKFVDTTLEIKNHLGKNIFYITDRDFPNEIILFWDNVKKNEITVIDAKDITKCDYRKLSYMADESEYEIDLKQNVEVIKNGVATSVWKEEDFKTPDSYIKVIDNDSDGLGDVVHFYVPEILVVDHAGFTDNLIISGINGNKVLIAPPENLIVKKDGKTKSFADITPGDVVYAYVSDDENSAFLDVSSGSDSGTVTSVERTGGRITLENGAVYEASDYYMANKDSMDKAEAGKNMTLYLDSYGRVVWIEEKDISDGNPAFGFIHSVDTSGLSDVRFKIFSENGEFHIANIDGKIIVDGTKYTETELFEKINSTPQYFVEKFIQYTINNTGNLSSIDTENYIPQTEPGSKMIKSDVEIEDTFEFLSSGVNGIYDRNMMIFPMEINTPTFVIPVIDDLVVKSADYDMHYAVITAKDAFPDTNQIKEKTAFYGQDEFGFPTFAVLYKKYYGETTEGLSFINDEYAPGYVVDELNLGLDENGSVTYVISGFDIMTGVKKEVVISSDVKKLVDSSSLQQKYTKWLTGKWLLDADKFDTTTMTEEELKDYQDAIKPIEDISCGDIVRCQMQGNSAIVVERVFKNNSGPLNPYSSADGSYYNAGTNPNWPFTYFRLIAGNVELAKNNYVKLKTGAGYNEVFAPETVTSLMVCDKNGVKKYAGKEFTSYYDDESKVVLFTQRQKNLSVIIYND